ncbi:MAG: hypothetical protein L3J12_08360 [Spirochaetales bacterium]|nr:hypothetical protein [Spirochaetales bacterium]
MTEGVSVSIRFYDKKIYYPESKIQIQVRIINNSSESYSFNSAEIRSYNFNFFVKTLTNVKLPQSEDYQLRQRSNDPVFYRKITLLPGEEYAFNTDLQEYIDIIESGIYIVQSRFYPDFQLGYDSGYIESNKLTVSVRPSMELIPELQKQIDIETGEILNQIAMPPDEVVEYFIKARQQGSWNKYFLYLDIEGLLLNHPDLKHKYFRLSEEKQLLMIEEYKIELMNLRVDDDISAIPSSFEITETKYIRDEGTVVVKEYFIYPDYSETKKYTFYLRRYGNIWTIYNYEVRNLGTRQ